MFRKLLLIFLIWAVFALPARATSVLPLFLDEIVADAAVAFQGTCTENRSAYDSQTGFVVTYTTFAVTDVLKGTVGATHTIKQVGGHAGNRVYVSEGTPSFTVGENYVVFLYGVSSAGFSSPVGLNQGRFSVRQTANGAVLSNGRDFKEMLRAGPSRRDKMRQAAPALPPVVREKLQQAPGELNHLGLDEFKQIVRQQAGGVK